MELNIKFCKLGLSSCFIYVRYMETEGVAAVTCFYLFVVYSITL